MEFDVSILDTKLRLYVTQEQPKDAEKYLNEIENVLNNENTSICKIGYYISQIFNAKYNIFNFINEIKSNKKFKETLTIALKFVKKLYQKFPRELNEYYLSTVNECVSIATSGVTAYEKDKALDIISCVLRLQNENIPEDEIQKIYNKFLQILSCSVKQSSVLMRSIFILLGVIARFYPNIVNNELELVQCCLIPLRNINPTTMGAATLYSGIFDGLSDIFYNFEHIFKHQDLEVIYRGIFMLVDSKWISAKHRNDDNRAAISFITKHSFLWEKCLKDTEYNDWHSKLHSWYISDNKDKRKVAFYALFKFYEVVAKILETRDSDVYTDIFKTFLNEFSSILIPEYDLPFLKVEENNYTRLYLHGLAKFSSAAKTHNLSNEYDKIFAKIINILNTEYLQNDKINGEKLEYFSDYIKCCSSLMENIETSEELVLILQRASVAMVKSLPKITRIYHDLVGETIILCFVNIFKSNEEYFPIFVQRFVCEAIIWSCNVEIADNVDENYYLSLWQNVIDINNKAYVQSGLSPDLKKSIVTKIFDEIIIRLMVSTSKLNLKLKPRKNETFGEDFSPENPNDYVIFLNMVNLYSNILETCDPNLFRKWIRRFLNHLIEKSSNNPTVSGYYKLLARSLKICDSLNYFDDRNGNKKEDKFRTFKAISLFLESIISKVQQFKDDLQLSCLRLIFASPICFVKDLMPILTQVFEVSFTFGLSYLKIADLAIDTLDRWYQNLDISETRPLLTSVLPYLDPYLRNKVYTADPNLQSVYTKPKKYRKGIIVTQKNQNHDIYETESELLKLQKKILVFVSQLEPEIMLCLIKGSEKVESVPWNGEPELKFTIPFFDVNMEIYLDKIVRRVVELALFSGDRKTRSGACEVLHGIMTVLLGTIRNMSVATSEKKYKKLFGVIITPIIQLGCDSDELIRQIFKEFNLQLIHWFTSEEKLRSYESVILIETLMTSISHPTNTTLRDYCGKCINEYVKWSIKQYGVNEHSKIGINLKIIIDQICSFCLHPNPDKRYGTALAFNNLYVTLREEDSMIDSFWVTLYYHLIKNLDFETPKIHKERNDLELTNALVHIERVFKEKRSIFNTPSFDRKVPPEIDGPILKDVLIWTLKQTATNNVTCRKRCIDFVVNLAPYVENCKNVNDFISKYPNPNWFTQCYESGIDLEINFGFETEKVTDMKNDIFRTLLDLLRCLDGYDWVLRYNVVDFGKKSKNSRVIVERAALAFLENATKELSGSETVTVTSESYNQLRRDCTTKIFNFVFNLVKFDQVKHFDFFTEPFWTILALVFFKPQSLGFNLLHNAEEFKLQELQKFILNNFNKLPQPHLENGINALKNYFETNFISVDLNLGVENVSYNQRQLLKGLLTIQGSPLKNKVVHMPQFFSEIPKLIFENLVQGADTTVYLNGSVLEYTELLLKLALGFGTTVTVSILWDLVNVRTEVCYHETFGKVKHGEYFLGTYRKIIMDYLSQNITELVAYFFKTQINPSLTNGGDVLLDVLRYTVENRKIFTVNYTELVENIMRNCQNYFVYSDTISLPERKYQINFLLYISKLLVKPFLKFSDYYDYLNNWFILTLLYENGEISPRNLLEFKIKLLKLLPSFTDANDTKNTPLESTLNTFLTQIDSLVSNLSSNGENFKYSKAYDLIFDEWIKALCLSKSPIVLPIVAKIFVRLQKEVHDLDEKFFVYFNKLNIEQECLSLKIVFELCNEPDENFPKELRYELSSKFFTSMLKNCSFESFISFFKAHLDEFYDVLSENVSKENLVQKMIYLGLTDTFFSRFDTQKVVELKYFDETEVKDLLRKTFILLKNVRKENYNPGEEETELYRKYNCCAFNAFITFISNTKRSATDINFYTYLLTEDRSKSEVIWSRIVNCNEKLSFGLDFKTLPKKKKLYANIRNELKPTYDEAPKYILTQNIFESSLSEDICQYDFSKTLLRNKSDTNSSSIEQNNSFYQINTESIDLNNHECMGSLCGLIQHMVTNQISPLPQSVTNQISPLPVMKLPDWLNRIREAILNPTSEINVKIFLARVIHNNNKIFEKYSQFFYAPIINLICTFENLNYFVADLLDMILRWPNKEILIEEVSYVEKLVRFLIATVHNDKKDILKFNLEILKNVVEIWKPYVVIPHDSLAERVKPNAPNLISTIQILGIFLANKVNPFSTTTANGFFKNLFGILYNKDTNSQVRNCTAEVLGMLMKNFENQPEMKNHLEKCLTKILDQTNLDFSKFISILEHVQIHYPPVTEKYFKKIHMKLMSNEKNIAVIKLCLKNLLRSTDFESNVKCFEPRDLKILFEKNDEDVQLLTLQLVERIVRVVRLKDLSLVVNETIKYKNSLNPNVREAMLNVFIAIYENYSENEARNVSQTILLEGLVDSDPRLQEKMQMFWCNHDKTLGLGLPDIFLRLLDELYSVETEPYYLGYTTYFLLEMCKNVPDYTKKVFENQLSECKFIKQNISQSWRDQHVFATPMFADIFSRQNRKIRQTLSPQFTPTQMTIQNSLETTSSFLFNTNISFSTKIFDSGSDIEMYKTSVSNKTYVRYAPRFLKEKSDVQKFYAIRETDKKVKREEFRRNRVKQRDANVDLYRNYQIGDFPDVVIPVSSIILPLQVLSKRDNTIARDLYVMLFTNLIEKLPPEKSREFLAKSYRSILKIFEQTTSYVPDLIGTFFDILLLDFYKNVKINPDLLFTLSKNSGLLSNGALILERQHKLYDCESPETKRGSASGSLNPNDVYWVKLAEIYKELKLWDGVTGIFTLGKMDINENILVAIKNESNGLWKGAIENYTELYNSDSSFCRKNFYCDSILKCYAHLCQWGTISDFVEQKVTLDKIWDNGYYQENILPWFFIAGVHETLQTKKNTSLLNSLEKWMRSEKSKYIKDNFSEELSILRILTNVLKESRFLLENCFRNFLDDYATTNPLFTEVRTSKLFDLQKTVEIYKYLTAISNPDPKNGIDNLISYWEKSISPKTTNVFLPFETKFVYRKFLIETLRSKFDLVENEEHFLQKLDRLTLETEFNFIRYALTLKNYYPAEKIIKDILKRRIDDEIASQSTSIDLKLVLAASECRFLKSEIKPNLADLKTEINKLEKICGNGNDNDNVSESNNSVLLDGTNLIFRFYDRVYEIQNGNSTEAYLIETNLVRENCIRALKKGIEIGESDSTLHAISLGENYMSLVLFLKKIDDSGSYNDDIIKYVLRGMKIGSRKACQFFSYILRCLCDKYEPIFIEESSNIPSWMFLRWIPQILANLDNNCKVVSNILICVAETYPQAIMYPYLLRKEKLNISEQNRDVVEKLDKILLKPNVGKFVEAISNLYVPQKDFTEYLNRIIKSVEITDDFKKTFEDFKNGFCSLVYRSSKSFDSTVGPVFDHFRNWCHKILDVIEESGNISDLRQKLESIKMMFNEECRKMNEKKWPKVLEFYSPWLRNFHMNNPDFCFEIPGQYKGDRRPLEKFHTTISTFKNEVHVYDSLQKPIKITILGNDGKEYDFLVKYGDDLRQDERIQQLCSLANDILQHDTQCSERKLSIETYNVTPLTGKSGLIQFVKETTELRKLIISSHDLERAQSEIMNDYIGWMKSAPKFEIDGKMEDFIKNSYMAYDRNEVCPKFRDFATRLPFDLLSKGFWRLSKDAESFTSLRYQFITSYATMCIINWLLGIGDRHLKNTLVCEKTGRAIGVDFGLAFDTMVRNLPYPELVPFRLTPQILNLIEPFREHGFIKYTMIHALRAFRKEKDILLSAMDVFINEPTLFWLEVAQKKAIEENEEMISTDFIPREKLANAENKFKGCNPIKITLYELSQRGNDKKDVIFALKNITRGNFQFNVRNRLPFDGLTVEDQVECLLDQATDENILGRCYYGYEPWV